MHTSAIIAICSESISSEIAELLDARTWPCVQSSAGEKTCREPDVEYEEEGYEGVKEVEKARVVARVADDRL